MVSGERHPTDHFVRAVAAEIASVLANGGSDSATVSLREGLQVGTSDDGYEYVFTTGGGKPGVAGDFLFRPTGSRQPWARAKVTLMPDGNVRLATEVDLGRQPPDIRIREDDTGPLVLLAQRLVDTSLNTVTAGWMLGDGIPRIGHCADADRYIRDYPTLPLNERQRRAIEHALGSELTFVWGPPGTGKTEVISRIVEGCFRQGLRVLFLAPTNVAVDQAMERFCRLLDAEDGFDGGLVQRAGEIALPSLDSTYGPSVSSERIIARLTADLSDRAAKVKQHIDLVRADRERREHFLAVAKRLDELRRELDASIRAAAEAEATARRAEIAAEFRQLEISLGNCHTGLQGVAPLDELRALERALLNERAAIAEELMKVASQVRARCRVMGATVSRAVGSRFLLDAIDVVVIDEAGAVDLPSAWCAAGLAKKRVVVAGDFRQLPAVTHGSGDRSRSTEDRDHSRQWMDRDLFHAAGLVDAAGEARPDGRMICLDSQYRMRPAICSIVNTVAYPDAPLRTIRDDTTRLPPSALIAAPLVLIDTTSRRIPYPKGRRGGHKSNPVHEAVIHEVVRGLQFDGVLPGRKWPGQAADQLAVIAPYKDQVRALRTSLKHRFGDTYTGLVDTVHRFQGSQRPLVIIDTVAGAGAKLGFFYEGIGLSSDTCRMLNVALSRAQDHLVVVADTGYLRGKLVPGSEAATMLAHLEKHAHRLSVDELLPVRSAADLADLSEEQRSRPAFFPADEVARAVQWDIAHAKRGIDIYCPFLDPRPVRTWLRHLRPRLDEGIRVTIHSRPQEEGTTAATLVEEIREARCEVSLRDRMHEKVLIIDDEVLWHGSLNLLANTGPTDLMMRVTDAAACDRVRRIMETAKMERPARPHWRPSMSPRPRIRDVEPGEVRGEYLFLDVPQEEKEDAKRVARARWDDARRLWYVQASTPRETVRRWLPQADS